MGLFMLFRTRGDELFNISSERLTPEERQLLELFKANVFDAFSKPSISREEAGLAMQESFIGKEQKLVQLESKLEEIVINSIEETHQKNVATIVSAREE